MADPKPNPRRVPRTGEEKAALEKAQHQVTRSKSRLEMIRAGIEAFAGFNEDVESTASIVERVCRAMAEKAPSLAS